MTGRRVAHNFVPISMGISSVLGLSNWLTNEMRPVLVGDPWPPIELLDALARKMVVAAFFTAPLGYGVLIAEIFGVFLLAPRWFLVTRRSTQVVVCCIFLLIVLYLLSIDFIWTSQYFGPITLERAPYLILGIGAFECHVLRELEKRRLKRAIAALARGNDD